MLMFMSPSHHPNQRRLRNAHAESGAAPPELVVHRIRIDRPRHLSPSAHGCENRCSSRSWHHADDDLGDLHPNTYSPSPSIHRVNTLSKLPLVVRVGRGLQLEGQRMRVGHPLLTGPCAATDSTTRPATAATPSPTHPLRIRPTISAVWRSAGSRIGAGGLRHVAVGSRLRQSRIVGIELQVPDVRAGQRRIDAEHIVRILPQPHTDPPRTPRQRRHHQR